MIRNLLVITIMSLGFFGIANAVESFSIYRGLDGELTEQSQTNLGLLVDIAKDQGAVRVWISFGVAFQADPELRTPEVVAQEAAARDAAIDEIVARLLHNGQATRIIIDPVPVAPGCMLEVNHAGLRALARNDGVKYIGYLPVTE